LPYGVVPSVERARNGSLGRVFDHVGTHFSDLAASERFYRTVLSVLGVESSYAGADMVGWHDWWIGPVDRGHPLTRGLHIGFRARDRAQVDAFWQAGVDAGYRDDGAPGPRSQYGPTYYGGFLLDPDGNSVEAVHGEREAAVPVGCIDHLWIRVRDPQASRRFYTTIAPHAGLRLTHDEPGRVQLSGLDYSFSLVRDERPQTEHVHLAFPAREDAAVHAFHAAALAAGYEDNGAPGERRSTTRATTARSCWTRTATTSRSSTTTRAEPWPAAGPPIAPQRLAAHQEGQRT
jgi:catechol 2,3-dioxygenase-like lactoylglutathione lyase family enzyme